MAICTFYTIQSLNSISTPTKTHLGFHQKQLLFYSTSKKNSRRESTTGTITCSAENKTVVIGLAADSGCGKSTFMRRLTRLLDPPELTKPPKILVIEGLHPMYDERVRDLLDFSIYLDISNEVKFAWKIQRDMAERGHSLESIKASIEARKPDFDAYIDPQKQYADAVIEVLPTQLIPDDNEGKVLRVRLIMKEGVKYFNPVYLFDEGSTVSWIPCGRKLTCSYPGIKFSYGPDTYYGNEVSVLEMDGQFDRLDELIYIESHLSNISTKFYGEVTNKC
ncbi:phosphoribulokinase [Actinidia rufa]|uniref:Phosphoribulokinase, chloroplastic n=1 Tax=Actinidia rufa TaxID=165716 RepID=A0A7J0GD48_9ERIC|nr:phosphoribulokinase [Actinidia rufa]